MKKTINLSDAAYTIGAEQADEWLAHIDHPLSRESSEDHRAIRHAEAVSRYKDSVYFYPLLSAWEQGFDSEIESCYPQTAPQAAPQSSQELSEQAAPKTAHKPFSWLHGAAEHDDSAQFVALTKTICNGIQTCLELFHASTLDRDNCGDDCEPGHLPTLSVNDAERLLLLATASAKMLSIHAEERITAINDRASKEPT